MLIWNLWKWGAGAYSFSMSLIEMEKPGIMSMACSVSEAMPSAFIVFGMLVMVECVGVVERVDGG